MKKVKLMLLSLSVLAVVGGALAFKAKGPLTYCTAPTDPGQSNVCNIACPNFVANGDIVSGAAFVCTTITSQDPAKPCENLQCLTSTRFVKND